MIFGQEIVKMKRLIVVLILICIFLISCNESPTIQTFTSTPAFTQGLEPTEPIEPTLDSSATEVPEQTTQEPEQTTQETTQEITSTPLPTPTQEPEYYLGDTIQQKGYGLTAVSIKDPYYTNLLRVTDSTKKHIAIEVIISNYSGPPFLFNSLTLYGYLLDSEGYVYPMIYQATYDPEIRNLVIEIGEQLSQRLVFEISRDAVPISLELYVQPINFTTDVRISTNLRTPPESHETVQVPVSGMSANLLNLPTIGSSVERLGASLTILEINPDNRELFRSGYKFVSVYVELENIAKIERITVNREDFFLIDEEGFLYPASEGVSDELPEIILDIGGKTKGWVIFGIPTNANPYGIKYFLDPETYSYIYAGLFN